jgi:hypothetical protein
MKCAKCGADSSVLETRTWEYGTTMRRRECFNGHRFNSIEIYRECYGSTRERCKTYFKVTMVRYKALWDRNLNIAREIAKGTSWEVLAEKYKISRSALYNALRAGRRLIPYSNGPKIKASMGKEYARELKRPVVEMPGSSGVKTKWLPLPTSATPQPAADGDSGTRRTASR